jgi:hypothetical protein
MLPLIQTGGGASGTLPSTIAKVSHQWLDSYSAVTGLFTQSQPAYSDLSGAPAAGVITWDLLGNAAGALTLANAGNATTFNQTSAVNWTWANTTAATSGTSQSSPFLICAGKYWDGAASQTDSWSIQDVVANGTNGTSTLTFNHTGSSGIMHVRFTNGTIFNDFTIQGSTIALSSNTGGLTLSATAGFTLTGSGSASIALQAGATFSGGGGGAWTFSAVPIAESTANNATWTWGQASELLTLSTSGTTTDTAANLLPANSIIEAVVARITTTITTATNWKMGDATTAGRFTAANSTLTSGTTDIGTIQADQTGAAGPRQTAAAKVRVTTTGTPGAGVVRITVFYRQFVGPTS